MNFFFSDPASTPRRAGALQKSSMEKAETMLTWTFFSNVKKKEEKKRKKEKKRGKKKRKNFGYEFSRILQNLLNFLKQKNTKPKMKKRNQHEKSEPTKSLTARGSSSAGAHGREREREGTMATAVVINPHTRTEKESRCILCP